MRLDLGPQGDRVPAEQSPHQHRQRNPVEKPPGRLCEAVFTRMRAMRRSRSVAANSPNTIGHGFDLPLTPHAADAGREIGKAPRLRDRDPDQPDGLGGQNPGRG